MQMIDGPQNSSAECKIRKAVADDEKTQGGAMMVLYDELVLARKAHSSQNSIKC
jgi:hypothetical protein